MFSTVYLEAQVKTQDVSTLKWVLRANGITIGSTWHEEASFGEVQTHLHPLRLRRMRDCDALVVVHAKAGEFGADLALQVGLALGWGLKVIWVGPQIPILEQFGTISRFDAVEDLRKALASPNHELRAA